MKARLGILAIALIVLCSPLSMAQEKKSVQPKLVIDSLTHDFGEVKAGEPLSYQFKVKNEGGADLEIKSVTPG